MSNPLKNQKILLKIPDNLYNQIKNYDDIGELIIKNDRINNKPEVSIKLKEEIEGPKYFKLNFEDSGSFCYFCDRQDKEKKDDKVYNFDAFAKISIDEKVKNQDEYNELGKIEKNKQKIGFVPIKEGRYTEESNYVTLFNNDNKPYSTNKEKRVRMDKNLLKEKMIELFQKYKYLSVKQITETLEQPDSIVKEVLSEVADNITEGEHKRTYKLKEIYE